MNTKISIPLFAAAALLFGGTANAITIYSDADYFGGKNWLTGAPNGQTVGSGQSISGTFNFVSGDGTSSFSIGLPYNILEWDTYSSSLGFTPGAETIVTGSGFMKFFIREGILDVEVFTFSLADISFQASVFATAFTLSSGVTATIEGAINATGEVAYSVSSNGGSFVVDAAYMEIASSTNTHSIPDNGATVLLFGIALLGVTALNTKFAS